MPHRTRLPRSLKSLLSSNVWYSCKDLRPSNLESEIQLPRGLSHSCPFVSIRGSILPGNPLRPAQCFALSAFFAVNYPSLQTPPSHLGKTCYRESPASETNAGHLLFLRTCGSSRESSRVSRKVAKKEIQEASPLPPHLRSSAPIRSRCCTYTTSYSSSKQSYTQYGLSFE